ncbi:MAG: hypothetical protein RL026_352 [Pseudomonadota bacterium]|jgi:peptidoglycan/xylan/chitin deacetylase (PgdA/CDA1 family)
MSLLPKLVDAAAMAAQATGALDAALDAALSRRPVWLVAMYHRVTADEETPPIEMGLHVSSCRFAEQLDFFRKGFELMTPRQVLARVDAGEPLPPRLASITFDDGYEDNYTIAAPLLRERGMPWSLYVSSGGLKEVQPLWWDAAAAALLRWRQPVLDLTDSGLLQFSRPIAVPQGDRTSFVQTVLGKLWQLPMERAAPLLERISASANSGDAPARMTAEQISRLLDAGVEIGCHTVRHPNLTLCTDAAIHAEVTQAKTALRELTGADTTGFAYPSGFVDPRVARAVKAAGCGYALAVDGQPNVGRTDRYRIQRLYLGNGSLAGFKLRLLRKLQRNGD